MNDYPRYKVAKDAGVSPSTMYRIIQEVGGKLAMPKQEIYKDTVTRLWATHSASEIEEATGLAKSRIIEWAKRLGLKHTQATEDRLKRKKADASVKARRNIEDFQERKSKSWKRTRKLDYLRFISGQEQQTKFQFPKYPERVYKAIYHLVNNYGYFQDEEVGGCYTMYYDEQTKRTPKEHLYIERYGLKFEQA